MKIAVTASGPTLDDNIEARFGRCPYFLIIDTDTMQLEAIENPNMALGGGAGIQSAQLMTEKGVTTVLTGNCGPNAFNVFGQAGIAVVVGVSGIVRQAIEQFKSQGFSSAAKANVTSHFGMNSAAPEPVNQAGGIGGSMGRGSGQGMGGGRGMGMGGGMGGGRGMGQGGGMGQGMGGGRGMGQGMPMAGQQPVAPQFQQCPLVAVVDTEKCTGCSACLNVCAAGAISVNQKAVINKDACNACAACVAQCPNGAIVLAKR